MIQEIVVFEVDKKLRRGAVDVTRSRHGDAAGDVLETVGRFVFDRRPGFLLTQLGIEPTPLDHESGYYPVKNHSIEVTLADVVEKVFGRDRRLLRVELDANIAHAGRH